MPSNKCQRPKWKSSPHRWQGCTTTPSTSGGRTGASFCWFLYLWQTQCRDLVLALCILSLMIKVKCMMHTTVLEMISRTSSLSSIRWWPVTLSQLSMPLWFSSLGLCPTYSTGRCYSVELALDGAFALTWAASLRAFINSILSEWFNRSSQLSRDPALIHWSLIGFHLSIGPSHMLSMPLVSNSVDQSVPLTLILLIGWDGGPPSSLSHWLASSFLHSHF
jgi:hypothetical protein